MGVGTTNGTTTMIAAGPGLLKRRYSVPEIIMRKHSLAQQKSYEESIALSTAPTSVGSGGIKSKLTSTDYRNGNGGNVGSVMTMGSDSNLSRSYAAAAATTSSSCVNNNNNSQNNQHHHGMKQANGHVTTGCMAQQQQERNVEYSMRKELLRRLWSKDMKIVGRPSSLSPPSRRTTPRRLCFNSSTLAENSPHTCEECQKLGVDRNNTEDNNNDTKRLKLSAGRSLDSSVIIGNTIKHKISPLSESNSSRPTTESSQPIHSTASEKRADASISDFSDNTYINTTRKEEQIRKSVLIYMTSLENNLLSEENARDLLRVEIDAPTTGDTSTHIESDFADKTNFEESADSGNGDATQNLDNFSSGEENEARLEAENLKNNNLSSSNTENNDDNTNGNNVIKSEETNFEESVSVPDNESIKASSRQTSVSNKSQEELRYESFTAVTNDSENNLLELIEQSNELALVEAAVSTVIDKNGNRWRRETPSPPLQFNEIVRADTVFPERQQNRPTALHITSQSSTGHIQDVIVRDGTMSYFPSYSLVESRGDVSSYTSHTSDQEPEAIGHVNSGSAYPELDYPYQVVVTRLSAIPRTMSMEVQPSSTSAEEELDGVEYDSCEEDSISLVDSLDDPLSPRPLRKMRPKKSAEAFFIPISDPANRIDENVVVSDSMPDSLKERLDSRQFRREMKKDSEVRRKRWKVEQYSFERIEKRPVKVVVDRGSRKENIPLQRKVKVKPVRDSSSTSTTTTTTTMNTTSKRVSHVKPQNKNGLRKEIGMLESYKIDARGNMQFKPGGKAVQEPISSRRAFKALPLDEPFVREPVQTSTHKKAKSKPEKTSESVRPTPKVDRMEERRKQIIKDVQQMTLYQQADLTPDIEGGPRRMYQKTEIQEGDKRIEILEIVECVDTTPESSPAKWSRGSVKTPRSSGIVTRNVVPPRISSNRTPKTSSKTDAMKSQSSSKVTGKTPKSSGVTRIIRTSSSRENSPKSSTRSNPNKDRAIADMLIDALNSNEDPNVEFVQSPKDHLKPNAKRSVPRKVVTNGSRRSANSGKYLHQFEVIPEEKSGMSFDSSNEDALSSRAPSQSKEPTVKKITEEEEQVKEKTETKPQASPKNTDTQSENIESVDDSTSVQESETSKNDQSDQLQRKSSKDSSDSATEGSVKSTFSSKTSVIVRHSDTASNISRQNSRQDLRPESRQVKTVPAKAKSPVPTRNTNTSSLSKNTKETKSSETLAATTNKSSSSKAKATPPTTLVTKPQSNNNSKPSSRSSSVQPTSKLSPNSMDILNGNVSSSNGSAKSESVKSQIARSPVRVVDKSQTHLSPQNSSERARAAVKGEVATSKGWGNFSKPYHGSPAESANEGIFHQLIYENASQNPSVIPSPSLSSSVHNHHHHHETQKNHHHRPSLSSLASTFTTSSLDPLYSLGSIMSPAAYTNAPTTSCGLELSYGASNACQQPQFHNHCALPSPSTTQKTQNPPLTSESDGCGNIMRIIDQTFRDNPDIFSDNYLKRFQNSDSNRDYNCCPAPPGTSGTAETVISRDLTVSRVNDDKKCDCTKSFNGTKEGSNAWQLIESNDCKLIQQRIEYFESFGPDADAEMNGGKASMFLYKENKIISGDGSRKNELKLAKKQQAAICSDSHDSGYAANNSSTSLNREKSACSDCCYCNPLLHTDPNKTECIYCRNKTPNVEETVPETPCSVHGYYETMKKSNHIHTRIKSRESDTVSVKCTKTNERIKRTCCQNECQAPSVEKQETRKIDPKGSKAGLSRPKDINNILRTTNVQKVEKEIHDKISPKKHSVKQSIVKEQKPKEIRLPSPYKCISSNSYESTSDSSCSLTCSPTKKTTLPQAHWQQNIPLKSKTITKSQKIVTNSLPRTSRASLYQHATSPEHKLTTNNKNLHDSRHHSDNLDTNANHYGGNHHPTTNNNNNNENNVYNIDSDTQYNNFVNNNNNPECTSPNIITTCHTTTNNVNTNGNNMTTTAAWSVTVQGNYAAELAPNVDLKLSFPGSKMNTQAIQNMNSNWAKRSSNNPANKWAPMTGPVPPIDQMSIGGSYKAPPALPAANTFNPKKNLTREGGPPVSNWIRTPMQNLPGILAPEDQNIGTKERKGIKSVASMITGLRHAQGLGVGGSRAMSFQSINRMQGNERFFDQATDNSRSTTTNQRRMSVGSEALSVSGERIAPEIKPKVPTMSEKDLTRKKGSSFTRNTQMRYQY
ncbi:uncharacterized protein LOC134837858 [Culicoides brevitarsis]|uniref:uncharacterized protein LOC134837858 n=1 Tax=Culicoides brevitarsis TaxID=469753 RepID=UPI00307C4CB5